jgi:hypothetical protein
MFVHNNYMTTTNIYIFVDFDISQIMSTTNLYYKALVCTLLENPPCMYVLVVAHTKESLRRYIKTLFETILRTHQNVTVFDTLST